MKDPWTCSECGGEMIKGVAHSQYLACPKGHGRLIAAPRVGDLPWASRAIYDGGYFNKGPFYYTKLYRIEDHEGFWKYIPYAHKTALDKKPGPGVVIAKVQFRDGRVQARAFRQSDRPRKHDA